MKYVDGFSSMRLEKELKLQNQMNTNAVKCLVILCALKVTFHLKFS